MSELQEPERLALRPRDVVFDWSALPMHWVPDDPFTTHLLNVLHLLLPEGERWFVRVFTEALPMIRDPRLVEDVRGFIGQEAVHAESHQGVLDHFDAHGLDTTPYVEQVRWLFGHAMGDREFTGPRAVKRRDDWLVERVAEVAAIEHFTAVLGDAVLNSPGLDSRGADPVMLDLLRWHGAEEIEHRAGGVRPLPAPGRALPAPGVRQMLVVAPGIFGLWLGGVSFLMANDPTGWRRPKLRDALRLPKYGLPSVFALLTSFLPYPRPGLPPQPARLDRPGGHLPGVLASSPSRAAAGRPVTAEYQKPWPVFRVLGAAVGAMRAVSSLTKRPPVTVVDRDLPMRVQTYRMVARDVVGLRLVRRDEARCELPSWEPGAHLDVVLPSGRVLAVLAVRRPGGPLQLPDRGAADRDGRRRFPRGARAAPWRCRSPCAGRGRRSRCCARRGICSWRAASGSPRSCRWCARWPVPTRTGGCSTPAATGA